MDLRHAADAAGTTMVLLAQECSYAVMNLLRALRCDARGHSPKSSRRDLEISSSAAGGHAHKGRSRGCGCSIAPKEGGARSVDHAHLLQMAIRRSYQHRGVYISRAAAAVAILEELHLAG